MAATRADCPRICRLSDSRDNLLQHKATGRRLFQWTASSWREACRCRLHRLLQFLERTHLDLADSLARHAEPGRQLFQRRRLVGEAARLEDLAFALVERRQRGCQLRLALIELLALAEVRFLARRVIDQ